ncbi:hypothetical protein, partial [Faecalibaculum rodentium]|uniref:hypothetical protein n=1 Tax=Faecalibaculum rodentium TaxID=1702221 RepID=UPI0025A50771
INKTITNDKIPPKEIKQNKSNILFPVFILWLCRGAARLSSLIFFALRPGTNDWRFQARILMNLTSIYAWFHAGMAVNADTAFSSAPKHEWRYVLWHLLINTQNSGHAMRGVTPQMA